MNHMFLVNQPLGFGRPDQNPDRRAASNFRSVHSRASTRAGMEGEAVLVSACGEDRMINPKTRQFMATRMGAKVRSGHVDHSPMYSATAQVIHVILEAARESFCR